MTLPLALSIPHAGTRVPEELQRLQLLSHEEILRDGDEESAVVYDDLRELVRDWARTEIARAFVDLNRAEEDRSKDGVVKTHTCWDVPIYRAPLSQELTEALLARYYRPYHRELSAFAGGDAVLAVDCHTMAATGPPVGPDPGSRRPAVCLGDGRGSCPVEWMARLRDAFAGHFPGEVTINQPFRGGYISTCHGREMPWIQLELARGGPLSPAQKSAAVQAALFEFCGAL